MKNLKFFSFLLVAFAFSSSVFSQTFTFGLQGGTTVSSIDGFYRSNSYSANSDVVFGVHLEFHISDRMSIVANVNHENKAILKDDSIFHPEVGTFVFFNTKESFKFTTIPLLFRYRIGNAKNKFFLNAGGYMAAIHNKYVRGINVGDGVNIGENRFETFEYGLSAGIGALHKINAHFGLSLEVRHNYALTPLNSGRLDFTDPDLFTNSFNVLIGTTFTM